MLDIFAVSLICAALANRVKHRWASFASIGTLVTYLMVRVLLTVSNPWIGPFALQEEYRKGNIDESTYIGLHAFWIYVMSIATIVIFVLFVKFASFFIPVRDDAVAAADKED